MCDKTNYEEIIDYEYTEEESLKFSFHDEILKNLDNIDKIFAPTITEEPILDTLPILFDGNILRMVPTMDINDVPDEAWE